MLQKFFAFFIVFTIFLIAFIIIKMAIPIWRFIIKADEVIKLYGIFKEILRMDFSIEEDIEISYGKRKLKFANTNEASIEFEKLVYEALECYDKLGWISVVGADTFKAEKDKLIHICSDVRTLRWEKQGV